MKQPFCLGYDKELDALNHYLFIYPAALVLAVLIHSASRFGSVWDFFWTFSIWLEAFAIIPQLYIVYKKREVFYN
jgi:hypothetical protein